MSSPPFKVKAVYEYTSPHDDDLHFPNGQIITVTEEEDDDWYVGEYVDASGAKQEGLFPKNFVEKYEPTAPPRPTRTKKKDPEALVAPAESVPSPTAKHVVEEHKPEPEQEKEYKQPVAAQTIKEPILPQAPREEFTSPPLQPKSVDSVPPPSVSKSVPAPKPANPAVDTADKPSGGSFRDRIAAFNKTAAPPPAPFKPGGLSSGSHTFIKKPFVPPPPSKNAYVPPPREQVQPQKVYRREEDPEILAKQQEDQEQAERAGLAPTTGDGNEEDQPKPTSLKERIALLQKQQQEQAARHAEAAAKKEKPKRPATKKRTESHDTVEDGEGAILEKTRTDDTVGAHSIEVIEEESSQPRRRKPSRGASSGTPGVHPRDSIGDGNEADLSGAGDTTEEPEEISTSRDDSDDKPRSRAPPPPVRAPSARGPVPVREPDVGEEEGATEEEEVQESEDEEDDVDPEVRRKEELRARMAKIGGGMGMYGMFGGPAIPSAPPKKKKSTGSEQQNRPDADDVEATNTSAPPVPAMVALPGMSVRGPEDLNKQLKYEDEEEDDNDNQVPVTSIRPANVVPDVEDVIPATSKQEPPQVPSHTANSAPPIPSGRPVPPAVPTESRPPPPLPPVAQPLSPSPGSESDDELSEKPQTSVTSPVETPKPTLRTDGPASPKSPSSKRASYFAPDSFSPTSPTSNDNKRFSRLPPPIPGAPHVDQPQTRAPPPPPPDSNMSRTSTGDEPTHVPTKNAPQPESEGEITEYEGDYDTDIASAAPHKDALRTHAKDFNAEDTPLVKSPVLSPDSAPPPPLPTAPRAVPPPLPSQPPPQPTRQSSDMLRAAPPPPPARVPSSYENEDGEYDPYRYNAPRLGLSTSGVQSSSHATQEDDDLYEASPQRERANQPASFQERSVPPPPPQERAAPPPPPREQPPPSRAPPRQSMDVHRPSGPGRRSVELSRMSMDSGFVANDIDLAENTAWWTKPNGLPPVFQGRKDILYEFDESTSNKRGGKTQVTKDLYVLFQDYSQTVITVQFDPSDPNDAKLEQRHEQPPARLRQDQLEQAHEHFGRGIYDAVVSKKDTVVGDGTPQGLIQELLKPFSNALLPVGTRAYGAVVYANLANASTTQNDEIRPGDIITLRNAKFQGKHGPMHAKYSVDVGKPDHVGVVAEWDGTKKKVRAWEQGRESKKNKMESFKLDDLRSGEVKIWRVMPRSWVGWQGQN